MFLTRVIMVRLTAVVLGQKIKNTQFVAMLMVGMVVVRVKMSHQRRRLRQLPRERRQALREQDEGEEYGSLMFHARAKIEKAVRNALTVNHLSIPKYGSRPA